MVESTLASITDRSTCTEEGTRARPDEKLNSLFVYGSSLFIYNNGKIHQYKQAVGPPYQLFFTHDPSCEAGVVSVSEFSHDEQFFFVKRKFKFSVKRDGSAGPVIRLDGLDSLWTDDTAWGGRLVKCAEMNGSSASRTWEIKLKLEDGDSTALGDSGVALWTTPDHLLLATRQLEDGRHGPLEDLMLLPVPQVTWKNDAGKKVATEIWESQERSSLVVIESSDENSIALIFVAWCARIWYYNYVYWLRYGPFANPMESDEASVELEYASEKKEQRKRKFKKRVMPKRQRAKKTGKGDFEFE